MFFFSTEAPSWLRWTHLRKCGFPKKNTRRTAPGQSTEKPSSLGVFWGLLGDLFFFSTHFSESECVRSSPFVCMCMRRWVPAYLGLPKTKGKARVWTCLVIALVGGRWKWEGTCWKDLFLFLLAWEHLGVHWGHSSMALKPSSWAEWKRVCGKPVNVWTPKQMV